MIRAARRAARRIAAAAFALALTAVAPALAQFEGTWRGLGDAEGTTLELDGRGERLTGAFTNPNGQTRPFEARRSGEVAEAEIDVKGARMFLRIRPRGVGLEVAMVPVTPDGKLLADQATAMAFVPKAMRDPKSPRYFMSPPTGPVRAIDARAFAASYAFWDAQAVGWGYAALEPRFRTVIRLYPLVQADLLWKLCAAPERPAALGEALSGQGVSCRDVAAGVDRLIKAGKFETFKDAVAKEQAALIVTLGCADDITRTRDECAKAAAETSRRALSMQTVATALAKFR